MIKKLLFLALLMLLPALAQADQPVYVMPINGAAVFPAGGNYILNVGPITSGTITVIETIGANQITLGTYSAPSAGTVQVCVPQGAGFRAYGTPGVNINDISLRGTGPGPCSSGGSSTANQGTAASASSAWPVYNTVSGTAVSSGNPLPISVVPPNKGTPNSPATTCGTSSSTVLAAGAASYYVTIRNPSTNTTTVWVNPTGAAATLAPPSRDLVPGTELDYSLNGFLPTSAITCIASSSTAIIVESK